MKYKTVIGVDLGGTKVNVARITDGEIEDRYYMPISAKAEKEVILDEVINAIEQVMSSRVEAIGIGVPGLVDTQSGVVYDMVNIPSWKKVNLGGILQDKFKMPVAINNDANCFVLGEANFGAGQGFKHIVGITLGTGLGTGLILNGQLYAGANRGAGEFGMLPYKDSYYEHYCSGQFFQRFFHTKGKEAYQKALEGQANALKIFDEFGYHLGHVLLSVFYAIDPQIIILGGAISQAYPFFEKTMRKGLNQAVFKTALKNLKIEVSQNKDIAVLGASVLAMEFEKFSGSNHRKGDKLLDVRLVEDHERN